MRLCCSQIPEDRFSRIDAHIIHVIINSDFFPIFNSFKKKVLGSLKICLFERVLKEAVLLSKQNVYFG